MKKILAIVLFVFITFGIFAETQKILSTDKAIQGLWSLLATSTDGGKTIKNEDGSDICNLMGTKLITSGGETVYFSSVYWFKTDDGTVGNIIYFTERSNYWIVTKDTPYILVQCIDYKTDVEYLRMIVIQDE